MKSIVAIVGRPNVGKSTLFNRLIGRREAIVESISGVTRDRHYADAEWGGKIFSVVDTGGIVPNSDDTFEKAIREQAQLAIEEADTILFVVDGSEGLTGIDIEIGRTLHSSGKKVLLVVNKCDNVLREQEAVSFYELGLGEPLSVSALSGRRTGDLLDAATVDFPLTDEEVDSKLKIALIGRPNVGKSSIANSLIGEERFIVTPIAGTTRDANDTTIKYYGEEIVLIDTAGLRKKKQIRHSVELFSTFRTTRAIERSDIAVIVIDADQGLERQDINVITEAADARKGLVIAVNKWDLVEKETMTSKHFVDSIYDMIPTFSHVPVIFISAKTKQRVTKIIDTAKIVNAERNKRISTSKLNEVLLEAIKMQPPPSVKGNDLTIKFAQQPQATPPVFLLYTNFPELMPESYKRFLERIIREQFGFNGVPLTLVFKAKSKRRED
ncbi:MAG: ribosome biogenesis GTPase Der [Chlorobi bacterium]|nr:ribosome biogenesis GTPase Der [Chlorobiota bacterium]